MSSFLPLASKGHGDTPPEPFFTAFIALHLFGFSGCIIMLLTVLLARTAPRHITWSSFVFSWIVSTTSYCLLFFAGQNNNPRPPFPLCLTQAALIYAAPPLTAATMVALVIQVYFNVRNLFPDRQIKDQKLWSIALLIIPYLIHGAMAIGCLIVGLNDPDTVQRGENRMYCNFVMRAPSKISSISVAVLLVPAIGLEIAICLLLRKHWSVLRRRKYLPSTILRVIGFSIIGVLAIALGIVFASSKKPGPELNLILAIVPAAAVLIFATQGDLVSVWVFWRKRPETTNGGNQVVDSRTGLQSHYDTRV